MKPYLLLFYGKECEHCERMFPLMRQLEKELGVQFAEYETWHDEKNAELLRERDTGVCGGVPFFWNTKSGKWLCGEVAYEVLKDWALGKGGDHEGL